MVHAKHHVPAGNGCTVRLYTTVGAERKSVAVDCHMCLCVMPIAAPACAQRSYASQQLSIDGMLLCASGRMF
jgi:hypothetical protein